MSATPKPPIETDVRGAHSLDRLVGPDHPHDGRDWECQCARCGSTLEWESCEACGGEGITGPGELYEQDPLWYDEDDYEPCHQCNGEASWPICVSTPEWCEANPMPGREKTPRHTPEWFVVNHRHNVRMSDGGLKTHD
jgi:hypothetical protein